MTLISPTPTLIFWKEILMTTSLTRPRILVTGSRQWNPDDKAEQLLVDNAIWAAAGLVEPTLGEFIVVHGAAAGLDSMAAAVATKHQHVAEQQGVAPMILGEAHPADWQGKGKAAGFIRNQEMIDLGADIVVSFPKHPRTATGKDTSRGTWHCTEAAAKAGLPVVVIWGDRLFPLNDQARPMIERLIATKPFAVTGDTSTGYALTDLVLPF